MWWRHKFQVTPDIKNKTVTKTLYVKRRAKNRKMDKNDGISALKARNRKHLQKFTSCGDMDDNKNVLRCCKPW